MLSADQVRILRNGSPIFGAAVGASLGGVAGGFIGAVAGVVIGAVLGMRSLW